MSIITKMIRKSITEMTPIIIEELEETYHLIPKGNIIVLEDDAEPETVSQVLDKERNEGFGMVMTY